MLSKKSILNIPFDNSVRFQVDENIILESGLDNKSFELVASRATIYENLAARKQKLVTRMRKTKNKLILYFTIQCSTKWTQF